MRGRTLRFGWLFGIAGLAAGLLAAAVLRALPPSAAPAVSGPREAAAASVRNRRIADVAPAGLRRLAACGQPEIFVDVPMSAAVDGRTLKAFAARYREESLRGEVASERLKALARQTLGDGLEAFDDVAPSLCSLLQDEDAEIRAAALTALGAFGRDGGSEPDETEAVSEDGGADETAADFRRRATVVMMTTGLADADPAVRDAAYETLVGLPDEERAQLSLQLMGNDDAALKLALLAETAQTDDEQSLTLNFHGLDADEPEIRQLAAENLQAKTGQTFESSEQAFDWYEKQLAGTSDAPAAVADSPSEDDLQSKSDAKSNTPTAEEEK